MKMLSALERLLGRITAKPRELMLEIVLRAVYFGIVTPYAFVWRHILRRGLLRSRGRWTKVAESTHTPGIFFRSS